MTQRSAAPPAAHGGPTLRRAAAIALACALLIGSIALGQDTRRAATETSIKAAYLLKLPAYVDWPQQRLEPRAELTIGVLGADALADELTAIAPGRTVNEHPVRVRRLDDDDDLTGVHVLFFSGRTRNRAERIAADAASQSILTVTDLQDDEPASVIDFVNVDGRVRFEVSMTAAQRNQLRLNSGLLAVAARVHGAPQ